MMPGKGEASSGAPGTHANGDDATGGDGAGAADETADSDDTAQPVYDSRRKLTDKNGAALDFNVAKPKPFPIFAKKKAGSAGGAKPSGKRRRVSKVKSADTPAMARKDQMCLDIGQKGLAYHTCDECGM